MVAPPTVGILVFNVEGTLFAGIEVCCLGLSLVSDVAVLVTVPRFTGILLTFAVGNFFGNKVLASDDRLEVPSAVVLLPSLFLPLVMILFDLYSFFAVFLVLRELATGLTAALLVGVRLGEDSVDLGD